MFCILNQIILIYAVNSRVLKVFYDCIGVGLTFKDFLDSRILRILSHIGTGQPVSWGDILHRYMECWATIFANCWHKLQFVDWEVLIPIPSWVFLISASLASLTNWAFNQFPAKFSCHSSSSCLGVQPPSHPIHLPISSLLPPSGLCIFCPHHSHCASP